MSPFWKADIICQMFPFERSHVTDWKFRCFEYFCLFSTQNTDLVRTRVLGESGYGAIFSYPTNKLWLTNKFWLQYDWYRNMLRKIEIFITCYPGCGLETVKNSHLQTILLKTFEGILPDYSMCQVTNRWNRPQWTWRCTSLAVATIWNIDETILRTWNVPLK